MADGISPSRGILARILSGSGARWLSPARRLTEPRFSVDVSLAALAPTHGNAAQHWSAHRVRSTPLTIRPGAKLSLLLSIQPSRRGSPGCYLGFTSPIVQFILASESPDIVVSPAALEIDLRDHPSGTERTLDVYAEEDHCAGAPVDLILYATESCPPDLHPSGSLESERGSFGQQTEIERLTLEIEGSNTLPRQAPWPEQIAFDLDEVPPAEMALLHVTDHDAGIRIRLYSVGHPPEASYCPVDEDLRLPALMDSRHNSRELHARLRRFSSRALRNTVSRLVELHGAHGGCLVLVLLDLSQTEIPWEMLEIRDGYPLGAIANMVRWTGVVLSPAPRSKCSRRWSCRGVSLPTSTRTMKNMKRESGSTWTASIRCPVDLPRN